MKKTIVIALLFAAAACSKKAKVDTPKAAAELSQADVERGAIKFPDLTLAQLEEGKKINDASCGNCHKLHQPWDESEAEWREIVPKMAKKANLDSRSEDLVFRYLVGLARK
jgi:cytochrome c5